MHHGGVTYPNHSSAAGLMLLWNQKRLQELRVDATNGNLSDMLELIAEVERLQKREESARAIIEKVGTTGINHEHRNAEKWLMDGYEQRCKSA
jgi:hypothetical protein